ncbi:ATP-dependent DNA ligase [Microbacterium oryzae]|uniref:ATP-dependent DNA ligase n=1 Tax=Microbacterium oryzae TaxID=743009 RepID=UPI0025B039EE|nr:ATP-dependent DNA ligase [Microbacterium oryzae]MDN3309411.1 ATP-dependent DNA ligase [Microbacterium oryzae]
MQLPVMPPVAPMLAKAVSEIPDLGHTEPKWDGFRTIVFRDGDEVVLGSRNERPMTRYFPELIEAIKASTPARCVVDGEIIVASDGQLDFEALQQRIHPAASRVNLLAEQTPASFVGFDLLAEGDVDLMPRPFRERRERLTAALGSASDQVFLTPATGDVAEAREWFHAFEGAGLDGVVAKRLDDPYQPNKRAMFKIKHERTADCVVAGFRWHKSGDVVGSLLLGLYDDTGRLQHVGVTASFSMARRRELLDELAPYRQDESDEHPWGGGAGNGGQLPGAGSRWNAAKDLSFVPLRPELVVEVAYDHMEGDRFRHIPSFRRWRSDRDPRSCTFAQLEQPRTATLTDVLRRG